MMVTSRSRKARWAAPGSPCGCLGTRPASGRPALFSRGSAGWAHDGRCPVLREESAMNRRSKLAAAAAAGVTVVGAGVGTAMAGGGDDAENERPISGDAYDRAADAALEHTGGGEVTGTEVGDEESMYEVEVTLDDGLQLDESFKVVGTEDEAGEADDAED